MSDDRPDEDGVSSDDLLDAAKSKFGLDDGSSGVADSLLGSSIDAEPSTEIPSIEEIAAELAAQQEAADNDLTRSSDEMVADTDGPTAPDGSIGGSLTGEDLDESSSDLISETFRPEEPADLAPVELEPSESDSIRFTIPDPGVPTGLPGDPVEVDVDQVLADVPAPPEVKARAGGFFATLWRNRWIVVVGVVGVSVLAGILDNSEPISESTQGDCFNNPSTEEVSEVDPIDCSDPHELEVFATVTLAGDEYPGDFAIAEVAFDECLQFFEGYIGEPYPTSVYYAFPFTPNESSWDSGDREALCVAYEPVAGTNGEEIASRTGSLRGIGE